jgi:hypothetical protein
MTTRFYLIVTNTGRVHLHPAPLHDVQADALKLEIDLEIPDVNFPTRSLPHGELVHVDIAFPEQPFQS